MLALGLFVLLCGPTLYMFSLGVESLGVYLDTFFSRSLFTGAASGDTWPHSWTVFYWSVWFAWAPSVLRCAGRRQPQPCAERAGRGTRAVPDVPAVAGSGLMIAFLLFVAFISFVTAADSSTDVIANLCSKGVTADSDLDGNPALKIVWGVIIGSVSWVMVSFVGIDGVKMLSNLGGLPGMLLVLLASTSLIFWLKNPALLDVKTPSADPRNGTAQRQPGAGFRPLID
ncbi:BCCT, betaine/carnitine/choline family transporter domain-containing protein [Ditylenchus destructor]|nr:BCCT, betaine/carnitine/choline family transporter domain-containing protein [Ditylenchus destructor]